ncbi:sodium calcium, partial [Colletotrichum incanum]
LLARSIKVGGRKGAVRIGELPPIILLGISFISGGFKDDEMHYPIVVARVTSQMLTVSLTSLILPTAFHLWIPNVTSDVLQATSRVTAITLLTAYLCYILFFYITHTSHFPQKFNFVKSALAVSMSNALLVAPTSYFTISDCRRKCLGQPRLSVVYSSLLLVTSCTLCVVSSVFVVGSKSVPVHDLGISKSFVGLVVVPLILSVPEQLSSVLYGVRRDVEWAIEESVSSCIRIALFILPFLVLLGWAIGVADMDLFFDGFQVTIITLTVLLTNYLTHGRATWFQGVILMCTYILFANAAWYYPN